MSIPKVEDIGTQFELDVLTDVSAATSFRISFKRPDQTTIILVAAVSGSEPTIIFVITPASFWTVGGIWQAQALIVFTAGTQEFGGDPVDFAVGRLVA